MSLDAEALDRVAAHLEAAVGKRRTRIVHLIEGDVPNARYWYGQARRAFPATGTVEAEIAALRAALPQAKR